MEERKYDKIVGLIATIAVVILLNIQVGDVKLLEAWLPSVPDVDPKNMAKNISYGVLFLGWILRQHIGYLIMTKLIKK